MTPTFGQVLEYTATDDEKHGATVTVPWLAHVVRVHGDGDATLAIVVAADDLTMQGRLVKRCNEGTGAGTWAVPS